MISVLRFHRLGCELEVLEIYIMLVNAVISIEGKKTKVGNEDELR